MAEERICPVCGRANALREDSCVNCGQTMAAGNRRMLFQNETEDTTATVPSWRRVLEAEAEAAKKEGAIPLPPQIKAEIDRIEAERTEAARRAAVRAEAAKRLEEEKAVAAARREEIARRWEQAETAVTAQTTPAASMTEQVQQLRFRVCGRCGTRAEISALTGHAFSFCHNCGADWPATNGIFETSSGGVSWADRPRGVVAAQARERVRAARLGEQHPQHRARAQQAAMFTAQATVEGNSGAKTNPRTAGILSFFLPGLGQMVNGQVSKGIWLMLGFYFAAITIGFGVWMLPAFIARIVLAVDAYRIAERRQKGRRVLPWEWGSQES